MVNLRLFVLACFACALFATSACGVFIEIGDDDGAGAAPGTGGTGGTGGTPNLSGKGVGVACQSAIECRQGLQCLPAGAPTATCQPDGDGVPGSGCILSADCLPSLFCALNGQCVPRSNTPSAAGGACTTEGDCAAGLACILNGFSGTCAMAGTGDIGAACMDASGCFAGLICAANVCTTPLAVAPWLGAQCPPGEDTVPKILFKVPRAADPPHDDFFSLPFPNDIRLKNGKVSMKNFPKPGVRYLPFDPVQRYIDAIEADTTGFALNTTVFARFARTPNFKSMDDDDGQEEISVFNITKGAPGYNRKLGLSWYAENGRGAYICPRYIRVRPGGRLEPGNTYVVLFKKSITDGQGQPFVRDADFDAVMAATAPADPDLAAAWTSYKPLRDWLADPMSMQNPDDVLAAAVFTTQNVEAPLRALRTATAAMGAQLAPKGLVKCDAGVVSPCDDGLQGDMHKRGCFPPPADANYDEYQGKVSFPIWQQGTRPYENPENGGAISFDATFAPMMVGTEDVCVSITVPKGTPPATGWPVVVYGHGTGGNYREFVSSWARDVAAGTVPGGAAVPMAMVSYDGALHGTRTGMTTRSVDELVFNILNPASARDTAVQGAADLFVLAQAMSQVPAATIPLDKAKLMLYGHSQGANAAAVAAPFEPLYKSVVLSGSGATLALSLVSKKKPVDIAAALPIAIQDASFNANAPLDHPLISVMQMYFERSDPANFVHRIFQVPLMDVGPKHLLHVFGTMDSFSPEITQRSLAKRAGLQIAGPVLDATDPLPMAPMTPVKANAASIGFDATPVTAVHLQFAPMGYDGHFVSSRNPQGKAAVLEMLGTTARDGVPTITPAQ